MYGWRGRIGPILPADNTIVEPEFAKVLPEGISAHPIRLSAGDPRDLGLPVITSNRASLSAALTLLGVDHVAPEYGQLFTARR